MTSDLWNDQTRTSVKTANVTEFPLTRTTDDVLTEAGHLRSRVRLLQDDTNDLADRIETTQRSALEAELEERTTLEARQSVQDMLSELANAGLAWRDIARLVGVSVPAVRKWRQGESATGMNRRALAKLLAFVHLLAEQHMVSDVPSWLEMPLHPEAPITGLDLYEAGRLDLLYDRAGLHLTDEGALDLYEPEWRSLYISDFEIFTAEDGERGIRLRMPGE
jgi:transcriptional regulator with XRE-family HTH domain